MNKHLMSALLLAGVLFLTLFFAALTLQAQTESAPNSPAGMTFAVNSTGDATDAKPGDGVCETATNNHICTLRAAIQEANLHPGADTINLQAHTTYLLTIPGSTYNDPSTGDLDITDTVSINGAGPTSTIIDGNGGAIGNRVFSITGTVTISGVTIQHGYSGNEAGGIYTTGNLTLLNTDVVSNTANGLNDWGGGIYNAGTLTFTNSILRGNIAGSHNSYGGAMYSQGRLLIQNSTIDGNSVSGSPGQGGGLFLIGYTATIRSSTISNNSGAVGGGIYHGAYPVYVINSTISGNLSNGGGGGILNGSGVASVFNSTVMDNQANSDNSGGGQGGGVANESGTFDFINSIIAGNSRIITGHPLGTFQPDDCAGAINSQANNLLQTVDTGYCDVTGSYNSADPKLGSLANNGGPTFTYAPLSGSPAIDGVTSGGCTDNFGATVTTDQRGYVRPFDGDHNGSSKCDIGAVEFGSAAPTPTPTPTRAPTRTPTPMPTATPNPACNGVKPAKPTLLKPKNGKKATGPAVQLDWNDDQCARTYTIMLRLGTQTGAKVEKKSGQITSALRTIALTKGKTYYWQITALDPQGQTKSAWFHFTVK